MGVKTIVQSNEDLPALVRKHNLRFAVKPNQEPSVYRTLDAATPLTYDFSTRDKRALGQGLTLFFANKLYTLAKPTSLD